MAGKLALDRDFTRFINDETFPYKVTVCIGDERVVCSGVLLAQQSKVLERKFREDDGVLLFEEMLEVENSKQVLHECIAYLHGADLSFSRENVEVILKFSSWYEIKDLFTKALVWLRKDLNSTRSVELVVNYLKVSNSLNTSDSVDLKSEISKFIGANKEVVGLELGKYLELGLTGFDIALIFEQNLSNSGNIMKKWAVLSVENSNFIVENYSLYNFQQIFPNEDEFTSFVCIISEQALSVESMKALLDIQKVYFTTKKVKEKEKVSTPNRPRPTSSVSSTPNVSSTPIVNKYSSRPSPENAQELVQRYYDSSGLFKQPYYGNSSGYLSSISQACHLALCQSTSGSTTNTPIATESNSLSVNVFNVPQYASEDRIKETFKYVGNIDSVTRCTREMSAVVSFQDSASVSRLLNSGRNYYIDGMQLDIQEHIESDSDYDSTDVYIGNLPPSASKKKLIQMFKFAGRIVSVEIDKEDSSAIVIFEDVDSANTLLDCGRRFMLDGYELDVEECSGSDEEESTVYIGNIPQSATKDNLKRLFARFGKINDITIKRKGDVKYAFVEFETEVSALALIQSSEAKTKPYELQGNILKIAMRKGN